MNDQRQKEVVINGVLVINGFPSSSADEMLERFGFKPGQLIHNAAGTESYLVTDVLQEVWFQAMWQAYNMPTWRLGTWLTGDREEWRQ